MYEDRVDEINDVLKKLYLAADGIECESSDYYFEKVKELKDSIHRLTQDSNSSIFTSEVHGWRVTLTDDYVEHCIIEENRDSVYFMLRETQERTGDTYDGMIFFIHAEKIPYEPDPANTHIFIASDGIYDYYCSFPNGINYDYNDPIQQELMDRMCGAIIEQPTGQIKEIIDSFEFAQSYEITSYDAELMVAEFLGEQDYHIGPRNRGVVEKDGKMYYRIMYDLSSNEYGECYVSVDGSELKEGEYRDGEIYFYN